MIKKYATVAGVVNDLGEKGRDGRCMQCKRADVTVYPYLSLALCAPCIVVGSSGRNT